MAGTDDGSRGRAVSGASTSIRALLGAMVGSHVFGLVSGPLEPGPLPVLHVFFGTLYALLAVRLPTVRAALGRNGQLPTRLTLVRVLLLILVVEHAFALVSPPYELGVPQAFHLVFGVLYAVLAVRLAGGGSWPRILVTGLLLIQFIGRFVVFSVVPETWIKVSLIPGTVATLAIFWLLWRKPRAGSETVGGGSGHQTQPSSSVPSAPGWVSERTCW